MLAPVVLADIVSEPSVMASFSKVIVNEAIPLEFSTNEPFSDPLDTSAALMPLSVYGITVPDATVVVVSVNVIEDPSLTAGLLTESE